MHLADGNISQTVLFKDYTLNFPLLHPQLAAEKRAGGFGKSSMSQKQLLQFANKYTSTLDRATSLLIEFHKRLVLAAGCFILSILAVPFAMRNKPGQRALGMPLGLSFFILYYISFTAAKVASESGLPVGLSMWTPNFIFALLAIYLLHHAHKEHTDDLLGRLIYFIFRIGRLIRLPGWRRPS